MKISEMILREDFYKINDETLSEYFSDSQEQEVLYIYPQLNAIITKKPSKKVKKYLYNEYKVRGNRFKALLIKAYVFLSLNSRGMFASAKTKIPNNMTGDNLIYPCNKKYRIFDFENNTVEVIAKKGFPTKDLEREIEFRTSNSAPFIPKLVSFSKNSYRENIIDGIPLARVTEDFSNLCEKAVKIVENYALDKGLVKEKNAQEYSEHLKSIIDAITQNNNKKLDRELLQKLVSSLVSNIKIDEKVTLTLSHGDLQPGNVWIDKNKNIFVIDWESWDERSVWYDRAIMFSSVRSKGLSNYIEKTNNKTEWAVVCLEDIIFRLNELYNLPFDYGEKEFSAYINELYERVK